VAAIMHVDAKRAGVKTVSGSVLPAGEISRVRQVKSMRMLKR